MKIDSFLFTNTGGREHNEDAVGSGPIPGGALFVVADGLGGHMLGERASAYVVEALTGAELPEEETEPGVWLSQQIEAANTGVLELQESTNSNMRSTVAALLLQDETAVWAHVGDSRIYYFHDRELCNVTEDHSVAYKKYKAGEITRTQICFDEDQSSLLRTLGNPERHKSDLGASNIMPGDGFLLCSDGIWEYLNDTEILIDFLKAENAEQWANELLLRVIARQKPDSDNLSLITVMIR